MIPYPAAGEIPSPEKLSSLAPELAEAAARVHGEWLQDDDGMDAELGLGGICQDVASAMLGVLDRNGFEHALTVHSACGENHVFVVALASDGAYEVDIPPGVYETGSGYVWRKRRDAVFDASCVVVSRIADAMSPDEFMERYSD